MIYKSTCQTCGKIIITRDKRGQKFCSRKCFFNYLSEKQKGKPTGAGRYWLGKKRSSETIEKMRQKKIGIKVNYPKNRLSYPCSEDKKAKLSISNRGENNHFWKGGISKLQWRVRNCSKYSEWRLRNYERDNFICQDCGQSGGILNCHHVNKSFAKIFQDNKITNFEQAMNCAELWDINNGITLCEKCHIKHDALLNSRSHHNG